MNISRSSTDRVRFYAMRQRGVVLFFTLIALVVMSLAAVALIRSVDTSTMIAGNLAFKQAGSASGDAGIEAAISWLSNTTQAMRIAGLNVYRDSGYALNNTGGASGFVDANGNACCQNNGYYSNEDPAVNLTNGTGIKWDNSDSTQVLDINGNPADFNGNSVRYIIQRMCRTANTVPGTLEQPGIVPPQTGCLFSSAALDNYGKSIPYAPDVCKGAGCPTAGQTAMMRITARVSGPKNTISYIQTFAY